MISAPARACERAVFDNSSRVESLSTSLSTTRPQWAVTGVLTQAAIGDYEQVLYLGFDRAGRPLDNAVVVVGARGFRVFGFRQPEQNHSGNAERLNLAALLDDRVDRHLIVARHGLDFLLYPFAGTGEKRIDEVLGSQAGLADSAAHHRARTQPPRPVCGERHESYCSAERPRQGWKDEGRPCDINVGRYLSPCEQ